MGFSAPSLVSPLEWVPKRSISFYFYFFDGVRVKNNIDLKPSFSMINKH